MRYPSVLAIKLVCLLASGLGLSQCAEVLTALPISLYSNCLLHKFQVSWLGRCFSTQFRSCLFQLLLIFLPSIHPLSPVLGRSFRCSMCVHCCFDLTTNRLECSVSENGWRSLNLTSQPFVQLWVFLQKQSNKVMRIGNV